MYMFRKNKWICFSIYRPPVSSNLTIFFEELTKVWNNAVLKYFLKNFLKSLGPLALQELLSIFNLSFSLAHCPSIWRVAAIIPLLNTEKFPNEVASFRSISLTSCVVKLLERILADRLYCITKTNNLFSRFQPGFPKGRSCEDQINGIVQTIEYGFLERPMQRSYWHF